MQNTHLSLKPIFWQYLLSAELPGYKSKAILDELAESQFDPVSFLLSHPSLTESERKRLQFVNLAAFEQALRSGVYLLNFNDFPETIKNSDYPPPALFVLGDLKALKRPMIAIVGTRKATSYGRAVAHRFAQHFAEAGVTVVSGGAYGIDTTAHKSALDAGGLSVAILPTGIDQFYPASNTQLFERIIKSGCILSPFAIHSKYHQSRPLVRNHVIAALADAVVVIEAPTRSGALVTAIAAAELSREVFVVPANIDNMNFNGSHMLLREGATLVDNPIQVLEALRIEYKPSDLKKFKLNPLQKKIIDSLSQEPLTLEKIIELTQYEASEVLSELTMLEIDGKVLRQLGGYALGS